jgi:hypothetical protein
MRHFLFVYTLSIYSVSIGMFERATKCALIAPARALNAFLSRSSRALFGTINVSSVTRQAQAHLGAAPRAIVQTKTLLAQLLDQATGQRRLDQGHSYCRRSQSDDSGDSRYQLGSLSLWSSSVFQTHQLPAIEPTGYTSGECVSL